MSDLINEIIHAMSALNMLPHETDPKTLDPEEYVSNQLQGVKQAMEHLQATLPLAVAKESEVTQAVSAQIRADTIIKQLRQKKADTEQEFLSYIENMADYAGNISSEDELSEMFDENVLPTIIEQSPHGADDEVMIAEEFSNYANSLVSEETLHSIQYAQYEYVGSAS